MKSQDYALTKPVKEMSDTQLYDLRFFLNAETIRCMMANHSSNVEKVKAVLVEVRAEIKARETTAKANAL